MGDPIKIDYIADWRSRMRSRIYTQFRNKDTWTKWSNLFADMAQDTEDAAQSLLTIFDIDNSRGAGLDLIGRVVRQARLGFDDVTYRLLIRTRILVNRSFGSVEDVYGFLNALLGKSMIYLGGYVKQFAIRVRGAITNTQARLALGFLRDGKEAASRGILEWQEAEDPFMFTFMVGDFVAVASIAGATTLKVRDTSIFASLGPLKVDAGTGTEENVTGYSIVDAGTLSVPAMTFAHSLGASVELLTGPGKGFGDVADATIGGYFANAGQA